MRVSGSKKYSEENYLEEYKMLREESQDCFRRQQEWSLFSITTVIALVSLALNLKNIEPEMYLLPYIVLCIASVKVHNLRDNILRIAGYMKAEMESTAGFMWETHVHRYRNNYEQKRGLFWKFVGFVETQEFTILGLLCSALYIWEIGDKLIVCDPPYIEVRYAVGIAMNILMVLFLINVSKNYFTLRSNEIDNNMDAWKRIL